ESLPRFNSLGDRSKRSKNQVSFLMFGCSVYAIRKGAATIRFETCPQAHHRKTVFERSRPSTPRSRLKTHGCIFIKQCQYEKSCGFSNTFAMRPYSLRSPQRTIIANLTPDHTCREESNPCRLRRTSDAGP